MKCHICGADENQVKDKMISSIKESFRKEIDVIEKNEADRRLQYDNANSAYTELLSMFEKLPDILKKMKVSSIMAEYELLAEEYSGLSDVFQRAKELKCLPGSEDVLLKIDEVISNKKAVEYKPNIKRRRDKIMFELAERRQIERLEKESLFVKKIIPLQKHGGASKPQAYTVVSQLIDEMLHNAEPSIEEMIETLLICDEMVDELCQDEFIKRLRREDSLYDETYKRKVADFHNKSKNAKAVPFRLFEKRFKTHSVKIKEVLQKKEELMDYLIQTARPTGAEQISVHVCYICQKVIYENIVKQVL